LRQPFQPFRFVIHGDEVSVQVDRVSMVKHEPGDRIVTVTDSDGSEWIIELDRVALIEVTRPKPKTVA
jgi:hypothetical protein